MINDGVPIGHNNLVFDGLKDYAAQIGYTLMWTGTCYYLCKGYHAETNYWSVMYPYPRLSSVARALEDLDPDSE